MIHAHSLYWWYWCFFSSEQYSNMYSVIIFEHGMQHICLRLSIWLHVCSAKMAPRCDLLADSCVGQQLGLSARSQEMGSTEIVVLFPITDPPPFCGSQKLQKFHNPSQPQPSTLQNQPERSCTTSATNRNPLSPLSTPESTASFPATPEPPVRPAVPALQRARHGASGGRKGHGGTFRSFLWGSLGIRFFFICSSSSIFPPFFTTVMKQTPTTLRPPIKKGAFQPPKFMGLRMKLRLCDSELTSMLCFCSAVELWHTMSFSILTLQCKSTLIANVRLNCRVLSTMRIFCQWDCRNKFTWKQFESLTAFHDPQTDWRNPSKSGFEPCQTYIRPMTSSDLVWEFLNIK